MLKELVFSFAALDARVFIPAWQLPTYDGTKSYQNLLVKVYGIDMGTNKKDYFLQIKPINFIRSGNYIHNSGSIANHSDWGNYWQLTAISITNAKHLPFEHNTLFLQGDSNKGNGFSIRCLVR